MELTTYQKEQLDRELHRADLLNILNLHTYNHMDAMWLVTEGEAIKFVELLDKDKYDAVERRAYGFLVWVISDGNQYLTARGVQWGVLDKTAE
jgi:hypothetical protein